MKFFYEKFWVPVFGFILSKFVFLIEGKKQDSKNKKKIDWLLFLAYKVSLNTIFKSIYFDNNKRYTLNLRTYAWLRYKLIAF